MSLLGETVDRAIDILIDIYANNTIGGTFYSFSTSVGTPVMSVNITDRMILQFTEYSELVKVYGLARMKKIQLGFTRASNFIGSNSSILENTPSFFLQASTIPYTAGSTTLQNKVAQSDNSIEVDLQTFNPKSWNILLPPSVVSNNRANNQTFVFGSSVWVSTVLNGTQNFPDLFINLGSLAQPTFVSTAPTGPYLVGQIHGRFQLSFAGPIVS
jgi:hypothetical protein